jgi:hypothetical protein
MLLLYLWVRLVSNNDLNIKYTGILIRHLIIDVSLYLVIHGDIYVSEFNDLHS